MKMHQRKYRLSFEWNLQATGRKSNPGHSRQAYGSEIRPSSEVHFESELNHAWTAIGADLPEQ
jgi:hypothetical protein